MYDVLDAEIKMCVTTYRTIISISRRFRVPSPYFPRLNRFQEMFAQIKRVYSLNKKVFFYLKIEKFLQTCLESCCFRRNKCLDLGNIVVVVG